ncbi:ferredoxin [Patescibacteria group bacterium]
MKKVIVDKNKCIACGLCSTIAPKTFKPGGDGKATVINPKGDSDKKIMEAIMCCPAGAISREK